MTKTTKLTIDVSPGQQAKLHAACPELFAAPEPDPLNWETDFAPKVRIAKPFSRGATLILDGEEYEFWGHELRSIGEALLRAAEAVDNA